MNDDLRLKYDELRRYGDILLDIQTNDKTGSYRQLRFYYMDMITDVRLKNGEIISIKTLKQGLTKPLFYGIIRYKLNKKANWGELGLPNGVR